MNDVWSHFDRDVYLPFPPQGTAFFCLLFPLLCRPFCLPAITQVYINPDKRNVHAYLQLHKDLYELHRWL